MNIRTATPDDSPKIHQIALSAFSRDQVPKQLIDSQLATGRVTYLLAEVSVQGPSQMAFHEGTAEKTDSRPANGHSLIAGFLSYRAILDEVDLSFLAVDPTFWGQGLAHELMQAFCERNHGQKAYLEVAENNFAARRLYEKFGFELYARRDGYYHDGQTAILMEKNL